MSRRSTVSALGLALVLILLPATLAGAEYRGTDMWANLGVGGQPDKIPLSYYALDYYVDTGILDADIPAFVGQFLVSFGFAILALFMRVTIAAFDWAFNTDIIGGRDGALLPVGKATQNLWTTTFLPLLKTAVLILGGWFVYKVVSRKFNEAGVGLARAVVLSVIALVIIFNPAATIGEASSTVNQLASGIVSGSTGGEGGRDVAERMKDTFIRRPWAVLNFGGLKRCVSDKEDSDGFPRPVGATDPSRTICRDVMKESEKGYGGYAPKFLEYPPGSDKRKQLFEALRDGEAPNVPPKEVADAIGLPSGDLSGWKVDKADAPAVDLMQAGGTIQRLAYFVLLAFGIIAAIVFLGLICFASLFVQAGLLVLIAATPAIAIAAIFPGAHGAFFSWAKWVGKFLVAKVLYAIILSAALGVSAALMSLGGSSGYLLALFAQGCLFGGIVAFRKQIAATATTSRKDYARGEKTAKSFIGATAAAATAAVAAPVGAVGAAAAAGKSRINHVQQEHAKKPGSSSSQPKDSGEQKSEGAKRPDTTSPPASAGREYSPNPINEEQAAPPREPSTTDATINREQSTLDTLTRREDPVPAKSFQEDYEKAKVERDKPAPTSAEPLQSSSSNGTTSIDSFAGALKQERAKTPNK